VHDLLANHRERRQRPLCGRPPRRSPGGPRDNDALHAPGYRRRSQRDSAATCKTGGGPERVAGVGDRVGPRPRVGAPGPGGDVLGRLYAFKIGPQGDTHITVAHTHGGSSLPPGCAGDVARVRWTVAGPQPSTASRRECQPASVGQCEGGQGPRRSAQRGPMTADGDAPVCVPQGGWSRMGAVRRSRLSTAPEVEIAAGRPRVAWAEERPAVFAAGPKAKVVHETGV
jgi:hypothetical protein